MLTAWLAYIYVVVISRHSGNVDPRKGSHFFGRWNGCQIQRILIATPLCLPISDVLNKRDEMAKPGAADRSEMKTTFSESKEVQGLCVYTLFCTLYFIVLPKSAVKALSPNLLPTPLQAELSLRWLWGASTCLCLLFSLFSPAGSSKRKGFHTK